MIIKGDPDDANTSFLRQGMAEVTGGVVAPQLGNPTPRAKPWRRSLQARG